MGGGADEKMFGSLVESLQVFLLISTLSLPTISYQWWRRTRPMSDSFLLFNSRSASVPLNHLLPFPSTSQKIGNPPTDLGRLCTYPQYLPASPKRISWSRIRARVGTVKFVVAVFAQLSLGIGSINSRGSEREVVLAESIAVFGTLRTSISTPIPH
jgi:hypothetical protein